MREISSTYRLLTKKEILLSKNHIMLSMIMITSQNLKSVNMIGEMPEKIGKELIILRSLRKAIYRR